MTAEREEPWPCWVEWKRCCALGKCSESIAARLRGFAYHRFHYYVRRAATAAGTSLCKEIDEGDAWHLFETFLLVKSTRAGKRYKDWLFARLDEMPGLPGAVIESGATLIMRDVVREHLRREVAPLLQVSLHLPLATGEGAALTLEDLLPGPGDPVAEVARGEYPAFAATMAGRLFEETPQRLRVAILAKIMGLSLADPAVVAAAACGKSVLSAAYGAFRTELRARVVSEFSNEGPVGVADLLARVAQELQERIFLWARSEKACARLFMEEKGESCL